MPHPTVLIRHSSHPAYLLLVLRVLCLLSAGTSVSSAANEGHAEKLHSHEITSKVHTIDRIYPSMKGPFDIQHFQLDEGSEPELIWLRSARVDVVDGRGEAMSSEYLCHSNLYFSDYRQHHEIFDRHVTPNQRFIDINQGLLALRLPDGFGIPMMSNENLKFHAMVFNLNARPEPFDLRVKTTFEYLRDRDRTGSIKPLAQRSIPMWIEVANPDAHAHHHRGGRGTADSSSGDSKLAEEGPHEGEQLSAPANPTHKGSRTRADGVRETLHWIVPPGRHEYRFRPEPGLRIPYPETSIHLLTGHMHAYGESIELRDLTTGKALFRVDTKGFDEAAGIEHMTHYSSEEGFAVYREHEYELIATYNNTTSHEITAMAVLYFYYLDQKLDERTIEAVRSRHRGDGRR